MSIDYENILKGLPDGILFVDNNFEIVFANERFKSIFNKDVIEGNVGKYIEGISFSGFKDGKLIQKYDVYAGEERIPVKTNIRKTEGGYVILVSLVKECICIDSLHMDFVSTVSHELRTPLTSMKGFIDTILSSGDKLDDKSKVRFLSIVQQQIGRLTRLVEDLLTVSRLEGPKSKPIYKSVEVKELCETILEEIKTKYTQHRFDLFCIKNLPQAWVDHDKAQQVLTNIIDNAAKYSYPNTTVSVELKHRNDFVEILVSDEGVGIPKEYLKKLFNKFARIDNPLTREVQGTGLGLYITKTLVESMGGEIFVESEEGKGSVFTVLFPVVTTERQAKQRFLDGVDQ